MFSVVPRPHGSCRLCTNPTDVLACYEEYVNHNGLALLSHRTYQKSFLREDDLTESAPEITLYTPTAGLNARVTRKDIPTGTFHYGRGKTGGI